MSSRIWLRRLTLLRQTMLDLHPAIERLLARPAPERRIGPFLLLEQLGRGGFAPVWLAKETYGGETLRAAAVKIFALASGDEGASKRIIKEARALCQVEHPNVVRFYSLAVEEDVGVMGLGMEFVGGKSLATRLETEGPLCAEQVIDVGIAISSALAAVHRAGLVHRDVKPANIVETEAGYKLIDFGIAATGAHALEMPAGAPVNDPDRTGRVAALQSGTLGYVDPVMIATGAPASPESDLYALGVTLFECLTGHLPAAVHGPELDERILDGRDTPPPVSKRGPQVPAALAALIDRMVCPNRSIRPASANDVVRALERLRELPRSRRRLIIAASAAIFVTAFSAVGIRVLSTPQPRAASYPPAPKATAEHLAEAPPRVHFDMPSQTPAAPEKPALAMPIRPKVPPVKNSASKALPILSAPALEPAPPLPSAISSSAPAAPLVSSGRPPLPLAPARDW